MAARASVSRSAAADMRRIFEAQPGLCLAMTPDLVLVAVTDSLAAALTKTREELVDHALFDVLPDLVVEDERAAVRSWRASIERVLATKKPHTLGLARSVPRSEERRRPPRFWESTNVPVIDAHGEVGYILHHTVEVFPDALATTIARNTLVPLLDDGPAAVALFSGEDLVVQTANRAVLRMWGRSAAVIGLPLREALPEIVSQGFIDILLNVLHTGTPFRADQMLVRLERGEVYFDFAYVPAREPNGTISGVFVFAYEVTDLVVARAEAQAANRMKDEFLTTLSHELRTPLTSILGWSALLADHPNDVHMRSQGLATILANARAQTRIVDDVLDVSRIIGGKMTLSLERIEVSALVRATLDVVAPAAHAKELAMTADIEVSIGPMSADPDRLRQILWNLLSNAVKFTPPRGHIMITARREGSHVSVAVRDTGIGIAPENIARVFERFRQVDAGTTRKERGLGLGLAIARHLAELHGGTVSAASDGLGKGSVFTVLLPSCG